MKLIGKVAKWLKLKSASERNRTSTGLPHWNLNPVSESMKSEVSGTYLTAEQADGSLSCQKLGENRGSPICIWDGLPEDTVNDV